MTDEVKYLVKVADRNGWRTVMATKHRIKAANAASTYRSLGRLTKFEVKPLRAKESK
jgi:hypothetical protein